MLLLSLFNVGLILLMFVVGLLYSIHYRRDILFFLLISLFVFSLILSFYFVFFINTVHCEGIELVLWGNQESISGHVGNKFTAAERAIWVIENVPPYNPPFDRKRSANIV